MLAEFAVALEMPFAAHGIAAVGALFRIEQHPGPPACRARALAGVMRGEAPGDVVGPADISEMTRNPGAAEDVNETGGAAFVILPRPN